MKIPLVVTQSQSIIRKNDDWKKDEKKARQRKAKQRKHGKEEGISVVDMWFNTQIHLQLAQEHFNLLSRNEE